MTLEEMLAKVRELRQAKVDLDEAFAAFEDAVPDALERIHTLSHRIAALADDLDHWEG